MSSTAPRARPAAREPGPLVIAHAPRERTRRVVRASIPRRHGRVVVTRTIVALEQALHTQLADAVVVDLGNGGDGEHGEPLRAVSLAREYPSVAFFAVTPFRPVDAPTIARCAALEITDVMADGVDDAVLRPAIATYGFAARFVTALEVPPAPLRLTTKLQRGGWREIVRRTAAGRARPVRTWELARALAVTREHLSRSFAASAAGTLKRVIDLVRLLAAAELAKNPGYGARDVARLLGYSSSSHLSNTVERLVGTRAASLSRLRGVDLITRFARGRGA